ncbi:DUF998 domain-containing protein [Streptosporangium sp. NPDC000095]|uniref:DUF998 domain-containing protein n=1 Tax=Streptosporangium sp. NPDC000095 TaxID=3366184 RepID=UPI0036A9D8AC
MAYVIGASGALFFVLVFLIDGLTRPGYSPVRHPVSALALGARGWIQISNFVVSGAAITVGGVSIATAGRQPLLGGMLAIFGLGLVASGFRMDPMRGYPPGTPEGDPADVTVSHKLHDYAGAVVFFSLPVTAAVAAFVLPEVAWKVVSAVAAAALMAASYAFGKAWERDSPRTGLVQRAFIVPGWLWVAAVFLRFGSQNAL